MRTLLYLGVVAYSGLLYVVGGDDGSSNLASIEFYNPKTDAWTTLPSSMTMGRSYAGVCIIDKPMWCLIYDRLASSWHEEILTGFVNNETLVAVNVSSKGIFSCLKIRYVYYEKSLSQIFCSQYCRNVCILFCAQLTLFLDTRQDFC